MSSDGEAAERKSARLESEALDARDRAGESRDWSSDETRSVESVEVETLVRVTTRNSTSSSPDVETPSGECGGTRCRA